MYAFEQVFRIRKTASFSICLVSHLVVVGSSTLCTIIYVIITDSFYRPGGRIHSCWLGDIVAELGANWKPNMTFTHPVYTLSATEDPPRPGAPGAEHPRGLLNRVLTGKLDFPLTMIAYHKFKQIEQEAANIYCLGGSKQHGSLFNFMSIRIQQELHEFPPDQQQDAARIMFGLTHMISARSGKDVAMLCSDHIGCFMNVPGGEVRIPLGFIGTVAPLLTQIPEGTIRYCKPVDCIYWGTSQKCGHRAIVCTTDGEEFPADYVIITASLGVLRCNAAKMFCPALPGTKMDAMRSIGFGYCNKIFMEYCRPFWYWHNGPLHFKYCREELCDRKDWTRGITAIEPVQNSKYVICVWMVGNEAAIMESQSDRDVAEGVTDVLRMSTGNNSLPYPSIILRSNWTSDPFFCGAYSNDCLGSDGQAQRALACPLPGPSEAIPPILLFAGEATVPGHFATVAAARISGIREAERIVELTLRFKGPPLNNEGLYDCKNIACKI